MGCMNEAQGGTWADFLLPGTEEGVDFGYQADVVRACYCDIETRNCIQKKRIVDQRTKSQSRIRQSFGHAADMGRLGLG